MSRYKFGNNFVSIERAPQSTFRPQPMRAARTGVGGMSSSNAAGGTYANSVDPQMAPLLAEALRLQAAGRPVPEADDAGRAESLRAEFAAAQRRWNREPVDAIRWEDRSLPLAGRTLRLREFVPDRPLPGRVLYVHGGGWVLGSVETHHRIMASLARATCRRVVGVDYRLAPDHPFPAPMFDVADTARAILEESAEGPFYLAGDSAGANLALGAALQMRDDDPWLFRSLSGLALVYGCFRHQVVSGSHRAFGSGGFLLDSADVDWFWRTYYGRTKPNALAEPALANLAGLPPVLLVGAGLDPLLDDTLEMSRALAICGVPITLRVLPGVVHGCLKYVGHLAAADDCLAAIGDFFGSRASE